MATMTEKPKSKTQQVREERAAQKLEVRGFVPLTFEQDPLRHRDPEDMEGDPFEEHFVDVEAARSDPEKRAKAVEAMRAKIARLRREVRLLENTITYIEHGGPPLVLGETRWIRR